MTFRAFIAVEIDHVHGMQDLHRDLSNVGTGLKPVDLGSVHVTLKFLGDTAEESVPELERAMREAVSGVVPFEMTLEGAGAFPSRNNVRVVWVGLKGADALGTIAARLDQGLVALGFPAEGRPFTPHLTLARVKDPRASFAASTVVKRYQETFFGRQAVKAIKLKRSELTRTGPIYTTVLEVPLH